MPEARLSGVIAAIATAVDRNGGPDCARSTALARFLLDHGCDALNVLGTTGEATSFSLAQRRTVMRAYRDAGLPMQRLMVGTGAAALADAVDLTRYAAELDFAAALLLPPFYYQGVATTASSATSRRSSLRPAIGRSRFTSIISRRCRACLGMSGSWRGSSSAAAIASWGSRIPRAILAFRARSRRWHRDSRCFLRAKRCYRRRVTGDSPAASPRPSISMPTFARAPMRATRSRSRRRSRCASCSKASRWSPASRPCSHIFMAIRPGRG
jgi:dihydrodipicolinate synthetase family protein